MDDEPAGLHPTDATRRAIDELDPTGDDLLEDLLEQARDVRRVVPECIGLSVGILDPGVVLTLVATDAEIAALDAGDGDARALDLAPDGDRIGVEEAWRLSARATAATGVRSTLTLPVVADGRATGSVNLYAASPHAFEGHQEQVAEIVGGWAGGAVSNADLSFDTRREAELAPGVVRDHQVLDTAVGIVAASYDLGLDDADALLRDTAARAQVDLLELARTVIEAATSR